MERVCSDTCRKQGSRVKSRVKSSRRQEYMLSRMCQILDSQEIRGTTEAHTVHPQYTIALRLRHSTSITAHLY
jgi:hypothetical protein